MNDKELQAELSDLVEKFNKALHKAEIFAMKHKLGFSIDPAYGMGGYFDGEQASREDHSEGWNPSSKSC